MFSCCTSSTVALQPLSPITRYSIAQSTIVTEAPQTGLQAILKTTFQEPPTYRTQINHMIGLKAVTLPVPVVNLITDYVLDREQEINSYKTLVADLRTNSDVAYLKLARLIESGFSVALIAFLSFEIPTLNSKLANVISWDKIPPLTARSLDKTELFAHLKGLKLILQHNKNPKVQINEDYLNIMSERVGLGCVSCCQHAISHGIILYSDKEHPNETLQLWNDMAEVAYPKDKFFREFYTDKWVVTAIDIKILKLSKVKLRQFLK